MAKKVHKIHSLPEDSPWVGGLPPVGSVEHPPMIRGIDRVLAIQRPVVLAHIRSIRRRHPDASPQEMLRMLERRYLAAVTTGGAAVGATAVVPGIGTGITLALSGVETIGFLESTALFAQSVAEVHGVAIEDPDRARALVLTLMLGKEGTDLVAQLAGQARGKGPGRDKYWGELVSKSLPRAAVGPLVDRLKSSFIHQFAVKGGASWIGKALPFGIGAAIGGAGNHILGRRVLVTSHRAFGHPPMELPPELEPRAGSVTIGHAGTRGLRRVGGAMVSAVGTVGKAAGSATKAAGGAVTGSARRERKKSDADQLSSPDSPAELGSQGHEAGPGTPGESAPDARSSDSAPGGPDSESAPGPQGSTASAPR